MKDFFNTALKCVGEIKKKGGTSPPFLANNDVKTKVLKYVVGVVLHGSWDFLPPIGTKLKKVFPHQAEATKGLFSKKPTDFEQSYHSHHR